MVFHFMQLSKVLKIPQNAQAARLRYRHRLVPSELNDHSVNILHLTLHHGSAVSDPGMHCVSMFHKRTCNKDRAQLEITNYMRSSRLTIFSI